jgi:uncharacterized protein (TIGR02246 family)
MPEDLSRMFVERFNSGDADGLAALYEPEAILAMPPGQPTSGRQAIREFYARRLANRPHFTGDIQRALVNGDLALTSVLYETNITDAAGQTMRVRTASAEVARRQPDGFWLWTIIDLPNPLQPRAQ